MAQKQIVQLIDDIDGTTAEETVSFSLDGVYYEIDLTTENADELRSLFARYTDSARRVGRAPAPSRRSGRSSRAASARRSGASPAEIREWARSQGMEVSDRGRISTAVIEAYEAAH